jgi:hypothetical protein
MKSRIEGEPNPEIIEGLKKRVIVEGLQIVCMALVEKVGSEGALDALRPYASMSAQAFILNMKEIFGVEGEDLDTIACLANLWEIISGVPEGIYETEHSSEKLVRTGFTSCPYRSGPKEFCQWAHGMFLNEVCKEIDPRFECEFNMMITKGDPICCYTIAKKQ